MTTIRLPAGRGLLVGFLLIPAVACSDLVTGPDEMAALVVRANLGHTTIGTVVVEVTAPDIATTLVFNVPVSEGVASGTLVLPAGSDRTITGRAFDAAGIETNRGHRTTTVQPGTNPGISLTLLPLHGDQPVAVTIGSYSVAVEPADATLVEGEMLQLQAVVRGPDAEVIDQAVSWATLQPAIATVDAAGLVTGHAPGQAQIVATYGGSGGSASVTVSAS